jgi:hypothetical protein
VVGDEFARDLDETKRNFEAILGQRCSHALLVWRAAQVLRDHLASSTPMQEREHISGMVAGRKLRRKVAACPNAA